MIDINPEIFRAYDIRGIYPTEINEDIVYKVAQAYAALEKPKKVVLGHDVRVSGPSLWEAAKNGLIDAGVDVIDVGQISTDMLYFTVANYGYDGGLTISASHNPKEFNGVKMVRKGAVPISSDNGIFEIRDWVISGQKIQAAIKGSVSKIEFLDAYCDKILSFLDKPLTRNYKVIANASFGMAGIAVKRMIERGKLPIELVELNFTPDGTFNGGSPNPLLPESQEQTIEEFKKTSGVDFGVVWDCDADRCFFYDESSNFIWGYYTCALLAKYFLERHPGTPIIVNESWYYATKYIADQFSSKTILHRTGHSFIKATMRQEDCFYAGEASGHYYFKDMFFTDNGLIPFIILLNMLEESNLSISELYKDLRTRFFVSGEINTEVANPQKVMNLVTEKYKQDAKLVEIDGVSFDYANWRFNLRMSNTEPVIRLNVESTDQDLVQNMTKEILAFIDMHKDDK